MTDLEQIKSFVEGVRRGAKRSFALCEENVCVECSALLLARALEVAVEGLAEIKEGTLRPAHYVSEVALSAAAEVLRGGNGK